MTPTERLLGDLIALPSVNPAFLPAGDPRAGERRVADYLAATAARAGLDVEFRAALPHRPNLVVRLAPAGRVTERVLLAPHLDTVGGESATLFRPRRRQGRLYGRGACDTKGSVAAMFCAMTDLARSPARPRATEIVFVGLVDEENAQAGSRAVVSQGMRADLAIVGEPTCLRVVTAHKGDAWLELETRGRSAHGSRPELGRNAVYAMARVVRLLETEYAAQLRRRQHPLLGQPTISVGTIAGGSQPNIVPDRCRISLDRRTLPGETEAGVRREILDLARAHGLRVRLRPLRAGPCPALETEEGLPLVRRFRRFAGQRRSWGVHYFCDAAVLSRGGTPSVVFGPGNIAQAHTADEWIALSQLERAQVILTRFLKALP
jgi:acetylornithine deacetylase/succinyl-diaminopimelate desuccinylase-like protein